VTEITVRGKAVHVRTSFKGRDWYSLPADFRKTLRAREAGDYAGAVPFLARVIEAWEFDGDPTDVAAYEGLEVMAELVPLTGAVLSAVAEAAFPKTDAGE